MQVVKEALQLLEEKNDEWSKRWNGYAKKITERRPDIVSRRNLFNEWAPLRVYMPLGGMRKVRSSEFSLRFHGADVANILVGEGQEARLILKEWGAKDKHHHSFTNRESFGLILAPGEYSWTSPEAKGFRDHFKKYDSNFVNSSEHMLESLILDELESKDKADKFQGSLHNIRPVELADKIRFQMPVPLKGNDGCPTYPPTSRGNIDILARIKVAGETSLGILELKRDDSSAYKSAIKQGLIYTASIHALLKSESGDLWWNIFGYKRDRPASKTLYSIALLPESLKSQYLKELSSLSIDNDNNEIAVGEDTIKCGYVFFRQNGARITVTDYSWKGDSWRAVPE